MRKLLFAVMMIVSVLTAVARDFTYEDMIYTVLDEKAKTVETKAGYQEEVGEEVNYISGNTAKNALLMLPSKVYDGDTEYTLTRIGDYSFCKNDSIMIAYIPDSVEEIGDHAFMQCMNLFGVRMAEKMSIGEYSFYGCMNLIAVTLPIYIEEIKTCAFALCVSLNDIEFPESLTDIGVGAFMGTGLEEIVLPESVKYVGSLAFAFSYKLGTLYLPSNLFLMGMQAFNGCENLNKIYYNTDSPAIIFNDTFDEDTYKQASLYVPFGIKSVMESRSGWQNFINIVETDLAGISDISNDNTNTPEYFDLRGMRIHNPSSGQIVIKRIGNKIEKIKL